MKSFKTIIDLLTDQGIITEKQLEYARRIQAKLPAHTQLLSILKELKYIDEDEILTAVSNSSKETVIPIGELLTELGLITRDDLERALAIQKKHPGKKIGQILVENSLIDERKLYELIACQVRMPLENLEDLEPEPSFFRPAILRICKENDFVPVRQNRDGTVVVAFADPLDKGHYEAARQLFGNIKKSIAPLTAVRAALSHRV